MNKHDHIIFSYSFNHDQKPAKIDESRVAGELKNEGLSWVHLDANSESTKKWLLQKVNYIDHLIIEALIAEETRPRVTEFNNGLLVIIRSVGVNPIDPEEMVSLRMWIDKDRIITLQRQNMRSIYELKDLIDRGKNFKSADEFLYNLIDQSISSTAPFLYAIGDKIDDIESKISKSFSSNFREEIIPLRSQIAIFKRYLVPQKEMIGRLRYLESSLISDISRRHFQENYDHISQMIEEAEEVASRAKILQDELMHHLNERINRNMFKLSIVAIIFMPLTFFTGLFGMNFNEIPGAQNPNGFYIFSTLMFLIAILLARFFKNKNWF
jgi:zinc transporter